MSIVVPAPVTAMVTELYYFALSTGKTQCIDT